MSPSAADTQSWTAERANRALPLVRRITADLVRRYAEWQALVLDFEVATARSTATQPDPEAERIAGQVQRAAAEIEGFVAELTELGIACKSLETGLLDFPGDHDGRPVYFCWKLGEPTVAYWHELDAGFAGRQAV